jgi:hypothetical protein
MAFVDKKESVIKIELTPFGKRKLAKGNFKPDHYAFFDDSIIYDNKYAGASDALNAAQTRIKESVSFEPQYLKKGLETSFDIETIAIEEGTKELFEKIRQSDNTEESEKLLSFPLGTMDLATQNAPQFNLVSWNNKISSTVVSYSDRVNNGLRIPQVQMNLTHSVTRDAVTDIVSVEGELYDSETFQLDFTEPEVKFLNGSKLIQNPEPLLISLEEESVKYDLENFEVEIFEIIPTDPTPQDPGLTEALVKLEEAEHVLRYFDIKTDDSVDEIPKRKKVNKNFFST